jgi:hypothetical protein
MYLFATDAPQTSETLIYSLQRYNIKQNSPFPFITKLWNVIFIHGTATISRSSTATIRSEEHHCYLRYLCL